MHGSQMAIESNRGGILTSNCGVPCVETETLSLSRSPSGTRMNVTITRIAYKDGTTGKAIPNSYPADSPRVGDSSYLEFAAPHLLKETIIHSSVPGIDRANSYWCGDGLAPSLSHFCGA